MADKPNSNVIEMASINKLKDAVLRTEIIEPEIHENDKTPSWDGELRLYKSRESFSKNRLVGRIPVQVKGAWVERFQKSRASFQVNVSDLQNYLTDGGVMFFLVQIKSYDAYKIYYSALLPFDLRKLVERAGKHQTAQIELEEFPARDKEGMLRILHAFLENKKRQATLLPDVFSLQDIPKKKIEIERFGFSLPQAGSQSKDELFDELLKRPQYVYAKPKNISATFAVDKIAIAEIVEHRNNPVKANGEVLYDHIDVVRLPSQKRLYKLGTDVTISIDKNSFNINYAFQGTLHEQICETKLILALMKKQPIIIGGRKLPTDFSLDFHEHTIDDTSDRLAALLRIDKALKGIHIKKDLNLGNLSEKEWRGLNHLVNGIMEQQPVPFNINGEAGIGKFSIGNMTALLATKEAPNKTGFLVTDFFAVTDLVLTRNGMPIDEGCTVSPYVMVTEDLLNTIDNIDLEEIVPSIKKFPYTTLYSEKIVLLILELLKYFDAENNPVILDIIIQLIDFLKKNDKSQDELYEINRLQTEKRRRKLSREEIHYLMSMKQSGIPLQYQLAANILLESFQEAQMIYEMFPVSERQIFDTFPIKNLWKN